MSEFVNRVSSDLKKRTLKVIDERVKGNGEIEEFDVESVAVTDGPRLVEPLRELGYTHVVAELDAHSKTLGTDEIVFSDFGGMIRSAIGWLDEW